MSEVILISEALHERRIAIIASSIASTWRSVQADKPPVKAVFIAGPSSSGKTTFSKRLGIQLLANGLRPYALSLDNFFVNREQTPRDENGDYDFESLAAVDLALLADCLDSLLSGQRTKLPHYNFVTGMREAGEVVQLGPDQILIIEGIHGLNPQMIASLDQRQIFRVYISVLTHLNLDRHNRLPPSDVRLLRRIVRDYSHRGYTATDTLERWGRVRQGEETWITPFKVYADAIFNSALLFEVSVLRPFAEPLLLQIDRDNPVYTEARRLLAFLQWVRPSGLDLVPDNSILREFAGDSILRHFSMFQEHFEK
jgi:uridine kinase